MKGALCSCFEKAMLLSTVALPATKSQNQSDRSNTKQGEPKARLSHLDRQKINAPDGKFKSPCNQQRPDLPTIAAPSLLGWSQGGHVTAMPTKLPFHSMSWMSAYLAGCLFIHPASETATTTTAEPTHCT